MIDSLYVHIPFCSSICSYCDFCKLIYNDKFAFSYIDELKKEIKSYGLRKYKTIYLGGGTPSVLKASLLNDLLVFLKDYLALDYEFTIEVNPESVDEEKLQIMKNNGINRISIGLQTTSEKYLNLLNRCSFDLFLEKYYLIKQNGFKNVNIDLMYALPNESIDQVSEDIQEILKLKPQHISTYSLILEENSIFGKKGIKEASDDVQASQYELILSTLRDQGYRRYEVSNFSLPGYESKHNLTYWRNKQYIGCGLGASGYVDNLRYTNTKSLPNYLKGNYVEYKEELSSIDKEHYYLITNLRLEEGFEINEFNKLFNCDFKEKYKDKLNLLLNNFLLFEENGRIKATDKGMLLLDRILIELI